MKFKCYGKLLVALLFLCAPTHIEAQSTSPVFAPQKSDRIILLGNTFADRMRHFGHFETLLQQAFPEHHLTLRNMGWSADEVGLQPRPLNFPGFGEKTKRLTEGLPEVTFKGFTHEGEPITMPVALNFAGLNQDLSDQKAAIIMLCFGMNEAFKGPAGLPQFEKDLAAFVQNLKQHRYDTKSAPTIVLVSPIAHEKLSDEFPDPANHNANLALYTQKMREFAAANRLLFVDLFKPTHQKTNREKPITINGIHLNDDGYKLAAKLMADALGFGQKNRSVKPTDDLLNKVIGMKDQHFFYRWRAVNGEYIYGRRREPFGVIAFPPELRKLNQMTAALDSVIWELAKKGNPESYQKALAIVDRRGKPADPALATEIPMTGRQGAAARAAAHAHHGAGQSATTENFTLPEGYEINLFASEKDFPIEKPVAMNFDAKGRLWVATMPTYPQYFPGIPVHDKIVILEDTDHDGKADKHTVFADDLYLPLGFEFGNGGVYVSQEPDILFLKDTNGDDKADTREVILSGFGSEDSHHATHAFTWGQDGALYFNEGTFLNSQVETPYGPVRSYAGATYRFEPRTHKLEHYISYPYYNPWGSVFDKWGMHLIGDASDGSNYFAPPMTGKVDYPDKHQRLNMFTETRVRPTAGIEIVSSKNFPPEVQGDFLVNNNIGFQGTKQHKILHEGSAIRGKETVALLQSSDPNYRPIDLEFGPDGALYIVDWYNPLISHGENPPRDPARDKSHGRIWRISYKNRPLSPVTDISKQDITQLLDNLKAEEDRFRYRTRYVIREKPASQVLPALEKWVKSLDTNSPDYDLHRLEALWIYQDFGVPQEKLLTELLRAKNPLTRAAATRVLRFWYDRIPTALTFLKQQAEDPSPRVRLEAVTALSFIENEDGVAATVNVARYPADYYLEYAISETFRHLKPVWLPALNAGKQYPPHALKYMLALTGDQELTALAGSRETLLSTLGRAGIPANLRKANLDKLAGMLAADKVTILLNEIDSTTSKPNQQRRGALTDLLLQSSRTDLAKKLPEFRKMQEDTAAKVRALGLAAAITAGDITPEKPIPASQMQDYIAAVKILKNPDLQKSFNKHIESNTAQNATGIALTLTAVEAKMAFDKQTLEVTSGQDVVLTFNNPDIMPHNVVIVKPGTTEKVGNAADAMAKLKDGFEKNFVPAISEVLFATPLVNPKQSYQLKFTAPSEPGNYPFICSFPGHWQVMQGILKVTSPKVRQKN